MSHPAKNPPDTRLLNLHELISETRFLPYGALAGDLGVRLEVQLPRARKLVAERILRQNGLTLSDFVRTCVDRLVVEYGATVTNQE